MIILKFLVALSRLLVGSLFVVSGLIKANDPLGFSYKLEEYFSPEALNWPFFEPYALEVALIVAIAEIILGFAVIVGGKAKVANWSLLGMILFFTWLTYYTATCDPTDPGVKCVTDCGCFGDALKDTIGRSLTPWESFTKDLILLVLIVFIMIGQFVLGPYKLNSFKEDALYLPVSIVLIALLGYFFSWTFPVVFSIMIFVGYLALKKVDIQKIDVDWQIAILVLLACSALANHSISHLPIKDFRPYAVGKSIPDQMVLPDGAKQDVYETILTYKNSNSGEVKDFTSSSYPWDDSTWVWVNTETKLIEAGDHAPIHDFGIYTLDEEDENDYAQDILAEQYALLIIAYDITKAKGITMDKVNELVDAGNLKGVYSYGLTASLYDDIEAFRHEHSTMFDFYNSDEITLKTVVRSNPGLVLLKEGTVIGKWHINDVPSFDTLEQFYLN